MWRSFRSPLLPPSAGDPGTEEELMLKLPGSPALSAFRIARSTRAPAATRARRRRAAGAVPALRRLQPRARRPRTRCCSIELLDDGGEPAGRTPGRPSPSRRRGAAAAGGAAARHDFALVEQGHRHRARSAACRACGASSAASCIRSSCSAGVAPARRAALAAPLHDRMTEAVFEHDRVRRAAVCDRAAAAAAMRSACGRAARRSPRPTGAWGWRCPRTRSTTCSRPSHDSAAIPPTSS